MLPLVSMEEQKVKEYSAQYRKKGYEVIEYPTPEQLPDFLSGFTPELLLRIGDYTKVVEIRSRRSLTKRRESGELARVLSAKPDWGHELVVLGSVEWLNMPEGTISFERPDILQRIETAKELLDTGFHGEALLVSWAALEATVRLRNKVKGIPPNNLTAPALFDESVFFGGMWTDDYASLMEIREYHNAVAHGFKLPEFDPAVVRKLNRIVKRLLPSEAAFDRLARRLAKV